MKRNLKREKKLADQHGKTAPSRASSMCGDLETREGQKNKGQMYSKMPLTYSSYISGQPKIVKLQAWASEKTCWVKGLVT